MTTAESAALTTDGQKMAAAKNASAAIGAVDPPDERCRRTMSSPRFVAGYGFVTDLAGSRNAAYVPFRRNLAGLRNAGWVPYNGSADNDRPGRPPGHIIGAGRSALANRG